MGVRYLLFILLSGCSIFDPTAFEATDKPFIMVEKKAVKPHEINKVCKTDKEISGCAVVQGSKCTIYVKDFTTEEVLGHELRHCFYGAFHD